MYCLVYISEQGMRSPVLRSLLEGAKLKGGFRCIKIHGVPTEAARVFLRFLYSSWYVGNMIQASSNLITFNKVNGLTEQSH